MSTRGGKVMLSIMKLTDEAVGFVVDNDGLGLVTIDEFAQLNEKSVEGLLQVIRRPVLRRIAPLAGASMLKTSLIINELTYLLGNAM